MDPTIQELLPPNPIKPVVPSIVENGIHEPKKSVLFVDEGSDFGGQYLLSNENDLYATFSFIDQNVSSGVGIYVGLDRGLDAMVNCQGIEELYITDYDRTTSLTTAAMLEIVKTHTERNGEFQDVAEFLEYFDVNHVDSTFQLLQDTFDPVDLLLVRNAFTRTFKQDNPFNEHEDSDAFMLVTYLKHKNTQQDYRSWVSDVTALNEIATKARTEKIKVANVNLGGTGGSSGIAQIAESIRQENKHVSVVDVSNILSTVDLVSPEEQTVVFDTILSNLGIVDPDHTGITTRLPVQDDTLFVHSMKLIPYPTVRFPEITSPALADYHRSRFGYFIQDAVDWKKQISDGYKGDAWGAMARINDPNQMIPTTDKGVFVSSPSRKEVHNP